MSTSVRNSILALLIAGGMLVTFYYLERSFRTGDSRRAIQAVQATRAAPNAPTVLEELLTKYGAQARIDWVGQTTDNFRGLILVTASLPDQTVRRWVVDLIHGTVSETKS